MNQLLFEFYSGTGVDIRHRSFQELIELGDNFLEKSHDIVQWLFPLDEPSLHNKYAPLLDNETIEKMLESPECMANLELAGQRFLKFFGDPVSAQTEKPAWVRPGNHNYLRITRIIKCYRLFGMDELAEKFFNFGMDLYTEYQDHVGETPVEFWEEAIGIPQDGSWSEYDTFPTDDDWFDGTPEDDWYY